MGMTGNAVRQRIEAELQAADPQRRQLAGLQLPLAPVHLVPSRQPRIADAVHVVDLGLEFADAGRPLLDDAFPGPLLVRLIGFQQLLALPDQGFRFGGETLLALFDQGRVFLVQRLQGAVIGFLQFLAPGAELLGCLLDFRLMLFCQLDTGPRPAGMSFADGPFALFDQFFEFPLGLQFGPANRRLHRRPAVGQGLLDPGHDRQRLPASEGTHGLPHDHADDDPGCRTRPDPPAPAEEMHRRPSQSGRSEKEDQKRPAVLQELGRRPPNHMLESRFGRGQSHLERLVRIGVRRHRRARRTVFGHGASSPPQDLLALPPDLFDFFQPALASSPDALAVLPRLVLVLVKFLVGGALGVLELPFRPLQRPLQLLGGVLVELLGLLDDGVTVGLVLVDGVLAELAILAAQGGDFLLEFRRQLLALGLVLCQNLRRASRVPLVDVLFAGGTLRDQLGQVGQGLTLSIQERVLHNDCPITRLTGDLPILSRLVPARRSTLARRPLPA